MLNISEIPLMLDIVTDLSILFPKEIILGETLETFLTEIKSRTVINYLRSLSQGSKPESVLRENFFSNESGLGQFLFQNVYPETSLDTGFIDYKFMVDGKEVAIEVKPLYDRDIDNNGPRPILRKLFKKKLNWEDHKTQINNYLNSSGYYVILTNLEEWYFFKPPPTRGDELTYFAYIKLEKLLQDFEQTKNFYKLIRDIDELSEKEPLDIKFLKSLEKWVEILNNVEFNVPDNHKINLIINLINKFIFIQSLDNLWVINRNYIINKLTNIEEDWKSKRKSIILNKFFTQIDEYFYELYDTELFKSSISGDTIINYIVDNDTNVNMLYDSIKIVLGILPITDSTPMLGITDFNFRLIDEDILGKTYEKYLAEIRKEKGIFYTPKYITELIVNYTVSPIFNDLFSQIKEAIERREFEKSKDLMLQIFDIKVLDPSCGSGSFLIKALREIWSLYSDLNKLFEENLKLYCNNPPEENYLKINELIKILDFKDKRKTIAKIILRHIYGNDLDSSAIETAKLNIWLEAIKLAKIAFQHDNLPQDTNHILPDLEMNLRIGDSLVDLPENLVIEFLIRNHSNELRELFRNRERYLLDPHDIDVIKRIIEIKKQIYDELIQEYVQYLETNNLDITIIRNTIPFFWALDYWFIYLNEDLSIKSENKGFDIILGNPPYFPIRGKGTGTLVQTIYYKYFQEAEVWRDLFRSHSDIYYYFIIRGIQLLKSNGNFGYIIENYWLDDDYGDRLREFILQNSKLEKIINFGNIKIFEDADNSTNILIIKKESLINGFKCILCKSSFQETREINGNDVYDRYKSNLKLIRYILSKIQEELFSDNYIDVFSVNQNTLSENKWVLAKPSDQEIMNKLSIENENISSLKSLFIVSQGVVPGRKEIFRISNDPENSKAGGYYENEPEGGLLKVINNKDHNIYYLEMDLIKPLITNKNIKRFYIIESKDYLIYTVPCQTNELDIKKFEGVRTYLEVYRDDLEERYDSAEGEYTWYGYQRIQNRETFEENQLKILCPYRAKVNSFAYDDNGYFGTTDMYAIIQKEGVTINYKYLLSIINSKLLIFWYKIAGKTKGNVLEFFATPINQMPIILGQDNIQNELIQLADELILYYKLFLKYRSFWENYTNKRNTFWSLKKILTNDKEKEDQGQLDEKWITELSMFIENDDISKKEYQDFTIECNENLYLKIYGINHLEIKLILTIKFRRIEYRNIVLLDLLKLIDSDKKINTLEDILNKSDISVIAPNIWELSHNLIGNINQRFVEWLEQESFNIENTEISDIYRRIENIEDQIDVHIFRLYGMNRQEIITILNALRIPSTRILEILNKFSY